MTDNNKDLTAARMLYEARTSGRRKREIATISRLLCIREEYLLALENGEYHLIPEIVYVLGFARNYAMELGLDPDEVVCKIKKELGLKDEGDSFVCEDEEDAEDDVRPAIAGRKPRQEKKEKNPKIDGSFDKAVRYAVGHWKWLLTGLVALALVILGVVFIASFGADDQVADSREIVAAAPQEPEYRVPVRERFDAQNLTGGSVIIQATDEAWVKIEDARKNTVFSRVMLKGDVYYMPEGDKYRGSFGKLSATDIWLNGKLVPRIVTSDDRKNNVLMTHEGLMPTEAIPEEVD
jgi:cytoskeletal protein RodZ